MLISPFQGFAKIIISIIGLHPMLLISPLCGFLFQLITAKILGLKKKIEIKEKHIMYSAKSTDFAASNKKSHFIESLQSKRKPIAPMETASFFVIAITKIFYGLLRSSQWQKRYSGQRD